MTDKSNKNETSQRLQSDDRFAVGAMIWMYDCLQEFDEQVDEGTKYKNDIGFNGCDAPILSNYVKFFRFTGYLSDRQLEIIHKVMPKYWKQVEDQLINPPSNGIRTTPINSFKIPTQVRKEESEEPNIPTEIKKEESEEPSIPTEIKKEEKKPNLRNVKMVENSMEIRFPYDPVCVAQVKELSGRKFNSNNSKDKFWTAPINSINIKKLMELGFSLDSNLITWMKKEEKPAEVLDSIPGFKRIPYQYQKEGIAFLEKRNGKALIADEMGLGKTIQALGYLQMHPEIRPAVIIAGASSKFNWEREIQNSLSSNHLVFVAEGKSVNGDQEAAKKANIIIINTDILHCSDPKKKSWADFIIDEIHPEILIIDECQKIKNRTAQRTQETKRIGKVCKHIIALSGTPLENRTKEIYNVIQMIQPNLFPNFIQFGIKYCNGKQTKWGWDFDGSSNSKELYEILNGTIMIRRKKADVLKDLPAKTRAIVPLPITNWKEYEKLMAEYHEWLQGTWKDKQGQIRSNEENPAEAMVKLEKIKQAVAIGKLDSAIDWIENFVETGEKLVVFTCHQEVLNRIEKEFKEICVKIDGSVTGSKRQEAVDKFQKDENIRLFIGNIRAAGEAITLTAASNTATIELTFNPAIHNQAEDRIHRIGQENAVTSWYLIAKDTIEEKIAKMLDEKMKNITSVLDGEETEQKNLLTKLINQIKEEK